MRSERARLFQTVPSSKVSTGFTLIEILVVVVVIAILAALVAPNVFQHVGTARVTTAKAQIEMIGAALDSYRLDVGRYPSAEEGLPSLWSRPSSAPRTGADHISESPCLPIRGETRMSIARQALRAPRASNSVRSAQMGVPVVKETTQISAVEDGPQHCEPLVEVAALGRVVLPLAGDSRHHAPRRPKMRHQSLLTERPAELRYDEPPTRWREIEATDLLRRTRTSEPLRLIERLRPLRLRTGEIERSGELEPGDLLGTRPTAPSKQVEQRMR